MATLTINGQKVTVDDKFLSLSPEQQDATVDEIAASIGGAVPTTDTGFNPYDAGAKRLTGGPGVPQQPQRPDLVNSTIATVNGLVNSVPVLGPMAQNVTDAMGGGIAQLTGGNYDQYIQRQRDIRSKAAKAAPLASLSGNVAGGMASYGGLAQLPGMAVALGMEAAPAAAGTMANPLAQLLGQMGRSSASTLAIGTADSMARGDKPTDAVVNNLGFSAAAGALPFIGAGLRAGGRALKKNVIQPIATMMNPENAVTANLGKVIGQDKAVGGMMTAADEAVAAKAGVPVMNVDRFGSATRRLARAAANVDGEAAGQFNRVVDDRFKSQGNRAVSFLKMLMGGQTDDIALKQSLRAAADKANDIAYVTAMSDPKARAVWGPDIAQLMQSDKFRAAINAAESRGTDKAAISGIKAVRNPFEFRPDGTVTLKVNADGSRALPSLQFWDQVKRNIDSMIDSAKPTIAGGGDRSLFADLTAIKRKLVGALDAQVPAYAQARKGAAAFFGAEDAIEAGRKAVTMTKQVPELQRGHAAFKPAEKDAASVGYASEMIDMIGAAGDGRNLMITNLFGTPSARARNELFLGKMRARELEAYVRVETIVDQLRGAVKGNSSTAEQLIAAGAVGTGVGLTTGDVNQGASWAGVAFLGMKGLKLMGKNVDERIMRQIAEILVSQDPAKMQRAIQNASLSKAHMDALEGIMRGMATGARGAVSGFGSSAAGANAPLEISVGY